MSDDAAAKSDYLTQIRRTSNYPTFRWLVRLVERAHYIVAFVAFVSGAVVTVGGGLGGTALICVLAALLLIVTGRLWAESASMLADVADSLTDLGFRMREVNGAAGWPVGTATETFPPDESASSPGYSLAGMNLSPDGQRLAVWLSGQFRQGLTRESVTPDRHTVTRSGLTAPEFAIALSEIERLGLINLEKSSNSSLEFPRDLAGISRIRPNPAFFIEIDRLLRGYDPQEDAVTVAALVANLGTSPGTYVGLAWIAEQTGWDIRRVNAVCYYLIENDYVKPSEGPPGDWACEGFHAQPRFVRLSQPSR